MSPQAEVKFNFELPQDKTEMDLILNAQNMYSAIDDINRELFRPFFKHGYNCSKISEAIEVKDFEAFMEGLHKKFLSILNEYDIEI